MKSIFKIPIAATPAADPIINTGPSCTSTVSQELPEHTVYCIKPASVISYIPIAPATNGTLSTIEERSPIIMLMT